MAAYGMPGGTYLSPQQQAAQIQRCFQDSSSWKYEKLLGAGGFGVALLLSQRGGDGTPLRIAMKIAQFGLDEDLKKEILWLRRFHGAKHIVKILAHADDLNNPSQKPRPVEAGTAPFAEALDVLGGLKGPAAIIEYLENGDLEDVFERVQRAAANVPNRFLWSLYLCMIRACIGMEYPMNKPYGAEATLETLPTESEPPSDMWHHDLFARNVMVTGADADPEHGMGKMFKLIDFGLVKRELTEPGKAHARNLFDVSRMIARLIVRGPIPFIHLTYNNSMTLGGQMVNANRDYPWLDRDLSDLLVRCMYSDWKRRPSLAVALQTANNALMNKTPADYPDPAAESDDAIRAFIQTYIDNVPVTRPIAVPAPPTAPGTGGGPAPGGDGGSGRETPRSQRSSSNNIVRMN
ncbi:hypothetical protein F5Y18DRAFT_422720 [Xylariaceae sp. FL1019]|nr:hypothetical protein F5Y18DRAFT_422720 [Xylariaceae sp. FL1019]